MSPMLRRPSGHDRAHELSARRLDEPLEAPDAAWLDAHLAACAPCSAAADAYEADRQLFAALRGVAPVPPRDLWARTAAAIDADPRAARPPATPREPRLGRIPVATLVPIAAVGMVAVVVGSTLLGGTPAGPGSGGPGPLPTAIATVGRVAVVTRGADGGLEVRTVGVDEVCPLSSDGCLAAEPSFETAALAGITASDDVEAIISPTRDRIVVVQREATGADGVYVVPVRTASAIATTAPTAGAPATPVPEATTAPTAPPAPPAPTATSTIHEPATVAPSGAPTTTASPAPVDTPAPTPDQPTEAPRVTATPVVIATDAPPATAAPPPTREAAPTSAPSPTASVGAPAAPEGAIEIARDVVVVGTLAAYDALGDRFAFTARPADGSAGPDVFVWSTDELRARAVTTDHGSVFAGWDGNEVLVSRVVDGSPRTLAVNPRTGAEQGGHGAPAWMPAVSPEGHSAVWWDGQVRLAADGVTFEPGEGRLVLGAWPGDPGEPEVLVDGDLRAWEVAWTPDGAAVAVWRSDGPADDPGRLSLYAVDRSGGRARLADPILADEVAFGGFSLEAGQLAWAAPAGGGERTVWLAAWDGTTVGKVELPGELGATLVR